MESGVVKFFNVYRCTMNTFKMIDNNEILPKIKIIGVGGAGIHIIQQIAKGESPFEYLIMDSNKSCLHKDLLGKGVLLGASINESGLGAGANIELGRQFATSSEQDIIEAIKGADMVFIIAGLGGGIGSGCVPVIAQIAENLKIPSIAFMTEPFSFEGGLRKKNTQVALQELDNISTAIVLISNMQLIATTSASDRLVDAFSKSGKLLSNFVNKVLLICTSTGLINVDFSDIKTIISQSGRLFIGESSINDGEISIEDTIKEASHNSLIMNNQFTLGQAVGVIAFLEVGPDFNLGQLDLIGDEMQKIAADDAEVMLGITIVPEWAVQLRMTIVSMNEKKHDIDSSNALLEFTKRNTKNFYGRIK